MRTTKRLLAAVLALLMLCFFAAAEEPATQWTDAGAGENTAVLVVVFPDFSTKGYRIHSDRATLLEALLALELVEVAQQGETLKLLSVDGCSLPADQPEAYWFVSMYDPALDSLTPAALPLDQLPLPGETYAFGMINGGDQ